MEEKKELWMVQTKRADFSGLAMRLGVSPVAVRVMRNRGLTEEAEMRKYLYGTLDDLYDPRLMKGMEQAAELIARKLKEGKHVRIIGDYDIDGVCSTYILLKGFQRAAKELSQRCSLEAGRYSVEKENDAQIDYEIPDRIKDGYGINESIIRQASADGVDTLGKHPGLIPGKVWVQVQESLERNKSKSFRKPRSNEALLTGLLFCSCGERMYPKMSKRKTADGKVIYTYVCKMKERSQRTVCNSKNANGNTLDMAIIEQVKMLADDKETFVSQLEQSRKFYTGNRMDYEQRISDMRKEKAETEKKINSLVDSLVEMGDSPAKAHVTKRIEQLNEEYQSLEKRIQELEGLTTQHALSDVEFDLMRQLLTVFKDGIDEMTIEQKRAAIRTIVRKVIWDGVNAHVVLFGVQDDEIEYPEIASAASDNTDDEDDNDELVAFSDVDYEDDDTEDDRLGKTNPLSASKTHWGEDSK